jgi:orotidine 5'-phosphate decarboxylase subfamily 2
MVEAAAKHVPAIKVQSAFFEAYGADGFAALETVIKSGREKGLITILDAKRGDISSTMAAYGHMAFETLAADALTITPYMGLDVLEPLWPWLKTGKGVYVVWISSNPSGALVQDAISDQLLTALHHAFKAQNCEKSLGLVLGATKVDQLSQELLDQAAKFALLMPGVGAQGGKITDRILGLKNQGCPILIPESRSLTEKALQASSWDEFKTIVEYQITTEAKSLHS